MDLYKIEISFSHKTLFALPNLSCHARRRRAAFSEKEKKEEMRRKKK